MKKFLIVLMLFPLTAFAEMQVDLGTLYDEHRENEYAFTEKYKNENRFIFTAKIKSIAPDCHPYTYGGTQAPCVDLDHLEREFGHLARAFMTDKSILLKLKREQIITLNCVRNLEELGMAYFNFTDCELIEKE